MNTSALRLLRQDARAWWYHQELRRSGQTAEARRRERRSMRETARDLRVLRHVRPTVFRKRGYVVRWVPGVKRSPDALAAITSWSNVHDGLWELLGRYYGPGGRP